MHWLRFISSATHWKDNRKGNLKILHSSSKSLGASYHKEAFNDEVLLLHLFQNNNVRHLPGFGPAVSQECSDCGKKYNMGGPIWSAPIHDQDWVASILTDVKSMKEKYPAFDRISAVLTTISEVCLCGPMLNKLLKTWAQGNLRDLWLSRNSFKRMTPKMIWCISATILSCFKDQYSLKLHYIKPPNYPFLLHSLTSNILTQ